MKLEIKSDHAIVCCKCEQPATIQRWDNLLCESCYNILLQEIENGIYNPGHCGCCGKEVLFGQVSSVVGFICDRCKKLRYECLTHYEEHEEIMRKFFDYFKDDATCSSCDYELILKEKMDCERKIREIEDTIESGLKNNASLVHDDLKSFERRNKK